MEVGTRPGMPLHRRPRQGHEPTAPGPGSDGGPARPTKIPGPGGDGGPTGPTDIPGRGWVAVLGRTGREFLDDELPDRAAALTYYGVLAIFPALLVLVSLLGLIGAGTTETLLDNVQALAPGAVRDVLHDAITQLRSSPGTGGVVAVVGLAGALWSASGYIGAFMRAGNAVYDIREGRPVWKTTPLRIGLTLLTMLLLVVCAGIVVLTGQVARWAGDLLGIGRTALAVWGVVKWPVLVVLVTFLIALLYWAAPNVRGRSLRWITPGSTLAVLLWLALSGGFAAYVANFASYNRTYGTVAAVIVFLVWLWLTNLAVLLGLELDAELAREQAVLSGMPPGEEPYVEPRSTRTWPDDADGSDGPHRLHGSDV
ncbi:YihY/virulence factor BrkB family protein [Kitasatospora terrestris]